MDGTKRNVVREVGEPPEEVTRENWRLFSYLFGLESDHHCRSDGTHSQLYNDIVAFLSMVNSRLTDADWIHWCWCKDSQCPCCTDENDSKSKTTVVCVNLFASSGFEVGSLARFTHTNMVINKLIAGIAAKRIVPKAFQFGNRGSRRASAVPAIKDITCAAEELGAGIDDMQKSSAVRKGRLAHWIRCDVTRFTLPMLKTTSAKMDDFQYKLFGEIDKSRMDLNGSQRTLKLLITDLVHSEKSPIVDVLAHMATLLTSWVPTRDGPWFLLPMCGINNFDNLEMRFAARRQVMEITDDFFLVPPAPAPTPIIYRLTPLPPTPPEFDVLVALAAGGDGRNSDALDARRSRRMFDMLYCIPIKPTEVGWEVCGGGAAPTVATDQDKIPC